jgi:hypothetical protein
MKDAMKPTLPKASHYFDATSPEELSAAAQALRSSGYCILRGLFPPNLVSDVEGRARQLLESPAVAGVPGYSKVDYPKRIANPFVLGGAALDFMLDERVVNLVESVMDGECVLAEATLKHDKGVGYEYFPLHADFSVGWKKNVKDPVTLSKEDLQIPIGIGGAFYLHDTDEGAFTYCEGSHLLGAPYGQNLKAYPAEIAADIRQSRVRCDGRAGDLVLFDDRGFHGPDQPSRKDRLVILLDYYRIKTFGYRQVSPMPIWSSDLGRLNEKQLRVAGAGADYMVPYGEYTGTRFKKAWSYPLVTFLIRNAFLTHYIRRRLSRS